MFRAIIFSLVFMLLPFSASAGEKMNILYTGAISGELEPCGCSPLTQSGGLVRLSGYISSKKAGLAPYIFVDAGNSLAKDTAQGRLKSEAMMKSFGVMRPDAAAFFAKNTPAVFSPLIKKALVNAISDMPGRQRSRTLRRGNIKVNVSIDSKAAKTGMLNILLTDAPVSGLQTIKGWDVVITSSGEELESPQKIDGAIIVSGYPKGQKLGILTLELDKGKVSGYAHRWQDLKSDVEEDASVRKVLNEYDTKVARLLKDEDRNPAAQGQYLGAETCVECHRSYNEGWQNTKHAGAFKTLERVGKSKDPECVTCHTTGYGEDGGFYSAKATPGLEGVQCEVCHGPGREHSKDFSPMRPIDESTCRRCHTREKSPAFDYINYREIIKHQGE